VLAEDKPEQSAPAPAKEEAAAPAPAPGVGSPVRDGKFEFTVTGVKCGVSKVGGKYLNKSAQGQFCLVTMQVKNVGNEQRTFSADNQQGFGAGEVKYGADSVASMYANDDNESFLNEINPGNGITVDVVFDIPKDGRLQAVQLHDSVFSGGVKVALG
jgi:hypothetical protein